MRQRFFCSLFLAVLWSLTVCAQTPVYKGFSAVDAANNRFVLVGDTQITSHWEIWKEKTKTEPGEIMQEIARQHPAFIINLGDLVFRASGRKMWRQFDVFHRPVYDSIPYFPILGNHNYYGNNVKALKNYFDRFPYLENRRWYSFSHRKVAFILLDSNFNQFSKNEASVETQWYVQQLQRFEADPAIAFVFVCCHHPPYTNSLGIHASKAVQKQWVPPFLAMRKTAFFFSGHCHAYEKFQDASGKYFIVSGGGGGPRQKLEIDPQKRKFADLFPGGALRFFHFCEVLAADDGLTINVHAMRKDKTFYIADTITYKKGQ